MSSIHTYIYLKSSSYHLLTHFLSLFFQLLFTQADGSPLPINSSTSNDGNNNVTSSSAINVQIEAVALAGSRAMELGYPLYEAYRESVRAAPWLLTFVLPSVVLACIPLLLSDALGRRGLFIIPIVCEIIIVVLYAVLTLLTSIDENGLTSSSSGINVENTTSSPSPTSLSTTIPYFWSWDTSLPMPITAPYRTDDWRGDVLALFLPLLCTVALGPQGIPWALPPELTPTVLRLRVVRLRGPVLYFCSRCHVRFSCSMFLLSRFSFFLPSLNSFLFVCSFVFSVGRSFSRLLSSVSLFVPSLLLLKSWNKASLLCSDLFMRGTLLLTNRPHTRFILMQ